MSVDMHAQNIETQSPAPPISRHHVRLERHAQRRASRDYWPAGVGLLVLGTLFMLQDAGVPIPGQQIWGMFFCLLAIGAMFIAVTRYAAAGATSRGLSRVRPAARSCSRLWARCWPTTCPGICYGQCC